MRQHGPVPTRVVTWNLQGRERPDLEAVARHLEAAEADIVLVQEVQRRQARALATRLGWHVEWRFKHWPVVIPAEGMALLSPEPIPDAVAVPLAHRWRFWSSDRRIAVVATVAGLRVVDTHLGAGVDDDERVRQAAIVAGLAVDPVGLVAGDLNAGPGSPVLDLFRDAGLRDAWDTARPGVPGPTNWPPGPRDAPPSQRLDYVLVGSGVEVLDASLPDHPIAFGRLSDHVPLTVSVDP